MVCVCNYSYCDDLDPIEKQPAKNVLIFESGKSGKRFKETKLKFSEKKSNELMDSLAITLTIDRSKKVQEIIGFGGSITDAAGININSLPMNMAINILKDYFSVNGLEYSVVRIPIAGCDFSTYAYSYDDTENENDLTHFALVKEDYYYKVLSRKFVFCTIIFLYIFLIDSITKIGPAF